MAIGTLQAIYNKIRRLTVSGNDFQLTEAQMADYVDSFYLYDLPAQFRSLKLKDKYTFNTLRGIDTYPFPSNEYTTIEAPVYCAKRQIALSQDPWSFYGNSYNWQYFDNFAYGDGNALTVYSGVTTGHPIIRSANNDPDNINYPASRVQNILITAYTGTSTLNVTDVPQGANSLIGDLIGDCTSGEINYSTGEITNLVFTSAVESGSPIQIQYNPVVLNIPLSILFFQNQFTLRPVPSSGFTIEMTAYRKPTAALVDTPANIGEPELIEWWELISVGASKKVYEDRLDTDGIALMDKMLLEKYSLAETRTYGQLSKQAINTIYSNQLRNNYASQGWFGNNGGY